MKAVIDTLNVIYIIIATGLICVVTATFYLGNMETYNALKKDLPFSFFQRMLLGIMLGVICFIILLLVNWVYNKTFGKKQGGVNLKRLSLTPAISTLVSSFIGAIIFFIAG